MIVCDGCGDARELDPTRSSPGVNAYKPCAKCGPGIGIHRDSDPDPESYAHATRRKKASTAPYEASPYRGGKLSPPAKP